MNTTGRCLLFDEMATAADARLVLVGDPGSGKSTIADIITGTNDFKMGSQLEAVTKAAQTGAVSRDIAESTSVGAVTDLPGMTEAKDENTAHNKQVIAEALTNGKVILCYTVQCATRGGTLQDVEGIKAYRNFALAHLVTPSAAAAAPQAFEMIAFTQLDREELDEPEAVFIAKAHRTLCAGAGIPETTPAVVVPRLKIKGHGGIIAMDFASNPQVVDLRRDFSKVLAPLIPITIQAGVGAAIRTSVDDARAALLAAQVEAAEAERRRKEARVEVQATMSLQVAMSLWSADREKFIRVQVQPCTAQSGWLVRAGEQCPYSSSGGGVVTYESAASIATAMPKCTLMPFWGGGSCPKTGCNCNWCARTMPDGTPHCLHIHFHGYGPGYGYHGAHPGTLLPCVSGEHSCIATSILQSAP